MRRTTAVRRVPGMLVLALGVGPSIAQSARPDTLDPERERAVLAVLRELDFGTVTAAAHTYEWQTDVSATPCLVRPERVIGGGFARSALGRVQSIGERLAAAYGVDWRVAPDQDPDPLVRPFLGFDARTNLGWAVPAVGADGADCVRQAAQFRTPDAVAAAWSQAREQGAKLCFVHAVQLLEVEGEAMVAATLVDFLNRTTPGPDVDLGAVFFAAVQRVPWVPDVADAVTDTDGFVRFELRQATVLRLEVRGEAFELRDVDAPRSGSWQRLREPRSTRGLPTRVQLPLVVKGDSARATLRVVQRRNRERVVAIGDGGVALLSGRFDPTQPFVVELALTAGRYEVDPHLLVGLPAQ